MNAAALLEAVQDAVDDPLCETGVRNDLRGRCSGRAMRGDDAHHLLGLRRLGGRGVLVCAVRGREAVHKRLVIVTRAADLTARDGLPKHRRHAALIGARPRLLDRAHKLRELEVARRLPRSGQSQT